MLSGILTLLKKIGDTYLNHAGAGLRIHNEFYPAPFLMQLF